VQPLQDVAPFPNQDARRAQRPPDARPSSAKLEIFEKGCVYWLPWANMLHAVVACAVCALNVDAILYLRRHMPSSFVLRLLTLTLAHKD
jgi:hypothetical protein